METAEQGMVVVIKNNPVTFIPCIFQGACHNTPVLPLQTSLWSSVQRGKEGEPEAGDSKDGWLLTTCVPYISWQIGGVCDLQPWLNNTILHCDPHPPP